MKNLIFILILVVGILSCKDDDDSGIPNPIANKEFVFALVSSQEECDILISQGVNCVQNIVFGDNKNASIIVTDIINSGVYEIQGNTVTIIFDLIGDVENPLIFDANAEFTRLTRISDGSNDVWKLQIEGVAPWDL